MTTYFTVATASLPLIGGNILVSADNPGSASRAHIIGINIQNAPVNLTYAITVGAGTGKVSAAAYYTIDPISQTTPAPNWFPDIVAMPAGTSVRSLTFPIQGFQFSVWVSGSANYSARLLQPGM